jgi:hypothetical protein
METPAEAEEAAKPAKKPKQKKDPNAPKKGLSAFMYFSADQRPSVKAEQPDLKMGEVAKVIGARCAGESVSVLCAASESTEAAFESWTL